MEPLLGFGHISGVIHLLRPMTLLSCFTALMEPTLDLERGMAHMTPLSELLRMSSVMQHSYSQTFMITLLLQQPIQKGLVTLGLWEQERGLIEVVNMEATRQATWLVGQK